ncbi:MAG: alpha/beta fold hydrolase [Proteobacteria bacterium]|nr:alpha/beta fold hydrolase [Pseudomonadota bacterium]
MTDHPITGYTLPMPNPAYIDHQPKESVGTLVCLPGVNSGAYIFKDAVAQLGKAWRIIRINVPGVDGVALELPFSAKSYARHVWHVLDQLGVKEPVMLLGHSMGGFAVQEMVRMQPERVKRLVLVSTSRGQPDMTADLTAMQTVIGKTFWQLAQDWEMNAENAMKMLFGKHFVRTRPDAYRAFIKERESHLPSATARLAHLSAGGSFSSAGWVRKIENPALVIHGTDDVLVRAQSGRKLAQNLPNGRWLELYGVGHFPLLENEQFWQRVGEFISGVPMGMQLEKPESAWLRRFKDFLFGHG